MLPVTERLIAEVVATEDVVRLANGMLAKRVNAARLNDNESASKAVATLATAFIELVAQNDPSAAGCFVANGGHKLNLFFHSVGLCVDKQGRLLQREGSSNYCRLVSDGLPGSVYLIEDVLTTGSSAMRAVRSLRDQGVIVEYLFALVDRGIGAVSRLRREGLTVVHVTEVRAYNEPR